MAIGVLGVGDGSRGGVNSVFPFVTWQWRKVAHDHPAARALSGDSSVAIPRALYEAVVEARKELP